MIVLKKIKFKNFLATGNQFIEVSLDKNPMTLVVGKNGAGKSTLIDAITFALFGKAFKKITKSQLTNTINDSDLFTEIEFTIGRHEWKVQRGIKPNIFRIYLNGKKIDQDAKATDYQKYLEEKVLKLNFKSFTQIVVLGSASFVPFMQLTANDRRVIIEDILDIGIFSIMRNLLKDRFITLKEAMNDVEYSIKFVQEKIKLQKKYIEELKVKSDEKRQTDLQRIKETEDLILRLNNEINEHRKITQRLLDSVSDDKVTNKNQRELEKFHSQIAKNLKKLNKDKNFFENNTSCPTCEQDIGLTFKQSKLKDVAKSIDEMDSGLTKLENEIEKVYDRLEEIRAIHDKINKEETEIIHKNSNIQAHNKFITKLSIDLERLQSTGVQSDKLDLLNKEHNESKATRLKYVDQQHYYDILGTVLNDKGIKTRIIKKYLPIINTRVNKYLKDMDFFVNFQLDENFNEVIKSRHRDDFSYYSFSEGEKKRIDISLLLTWRDIASMRNSVNVNLLILDEVFDASLDQAGVDDLTKLFDILKNTNLFVISHKLDILDDKFSNKIIVEKVKNFTKMTAE